MTSISKLSLSKASLFKVTLTLAAGLYGSAALAAIQSKEIPYTAADGTKLVSYYVYDDAIKTKRPGILVVHEWWGLNDYARKRATQLAKLGYAALAIDMYGDGKHTEKASEAMEMMHGVFNDASTSMTRAKAGLELLEAQPQVDTSKIGAIGYCFGGKIVLDMARAGLPLAGVASFHGVLATATPAQASVVKAKILVLHGEADTMVKPAEVDAFKAEMKAGNVPYQFISYPNAKHGFSSPAADRLGKENMIDVGYNAAADKKSWHDMRVFFNSVFGEKH
ncbi:dienelactone hydrolase family protein [Aquirhabdus parva]|uniref:Dienelactone hydrolase family protein n=1 Tax=Aquirhabdus parva TaxID=2283318 RepID=A0A345PAM0_9GAMM|nr:dienelactone hydrolase family protein [Aquirhabdus parva]AXI04329.1 dienelactone hydrolase family protein [Aquirhabdus parva]